MQALIIQTVSLIIECGMIPTAGAIVSYLRSERAQDVERDLAELVSTGMLYLKDGEYWVTTAGHAAYEEALDNPFEPQPHYHEWLDAVLTGMDRDGNPVNVENPAIPQQLAPPAGDSEYSMIAAINERRRVEKRRFNRDRRRYRKNGGK